MPRLAFADLFTPVTEGQFSYFLPLGSVLKQDFARKASTICRLMAIHTQTTS